MAADHTSIGTRSIGFVNKEESGQVQGSRNVLKTKFFWNPVQYEVVGPVFFYGRHLPGGGRLVDDTDPAVVVKQDLCCPRHHLLKHNSANYVDRTLKFDKLTF